MAEENQPRNFTLEGNDTSGYVGVDPEYRSYANETDKPLLSDEEKKRMEEVGLLTDDEKLAANTESVDEPTDAVQGDDGLTSPL